MRKNEDDECMVEHHICYKEIEGWDETVWITNREHQLLHKRLRDEGICDISPKRLAIIAKAAHGRTKKGKEYLRKYYEENKEEIKARSRQNGIEYRLQNKEKMSIQSREWYHKNKGRK